MKHKVQLEWNAFRYDLNMDLLQIVNVIDDSLIKDIEISYKKKKINSYDDLKEIIRKYFLWKYWSRTEYEVIVTKMFPNTKSIKIDIFWQLEMNLDRIVEYINKEMQIVL